MAGRKSPADRNKGQATEPLPVDIYPLGHHTDTGRSKTSKTSPKTVIHEQYFLLKHYPNKELKKNRLPSSLAMASLIFI